MDWIIVIGIFLFALCVLYYLYTDYKKTLTDREYEISEEDKDKMNIILSKFKTLLNKGYSVEEIITFLEKMDK